MARIVTLGDLRQPSSNPSSSALSSVASFIDHTLNSSLVTTAYSLSPINTGSSRETFLRRLGMHSILLIQVIVLIFENLFLGNAGFENFLWFILRVFWLVWLMWVMARMENVVSAVLFLKLRMTKRFLNLFISVMGILHVAVFLIILYGMTHSLVDTLSRWWNYWWTLRALIWVIGNMVAWGKEEGEVELV